MSQLLIEDAPDIRNLITEDETPVDNLPSEKQYRLLTEPLYSSWAGPGDGRTFLVAANVGVFYMVRAQPVVPDVFLSLDVEVADNFWEKEHRSYFLWEFGKLPDLAIEIVSNKEGKEDGEKKQKYARMQIKYYVIYDPTHQILPDVLTIYHLRDFDFERQESLQFPSLKLGLALWEGSFEGKHDTWLRWTDDAGQIIPTGKEQAAEERRRANDTEVLLNATEALLKAERERADRLAEALRQIGQDPNTL